MKHYVIWLKSGECISGDIPDKVENTITLDGRNVLRFTDIDGTVTIKRNRIEAIAINNVVETCKCGF